jgi:hypothetical protein
VRVGAALLPVEGVEEPAVEHRLEAAPEPGEVERVGDEERHREAARGRLLAARAIADGAASIPITRRPRAARWSAFSPVPQPTSSTDPTTRPASASFTISAWGRPISQGTSPAR